MYTMLSNMYWDKFLWLNINIDLHNPDKVKIQNL